MNPCPKASTREKWRWLHQLEPHSPAFWSLLTHFEKTPFYFRNQALSFRGEVDGIAMCELKLINSHGIVFATLSAPAAPFQKYWVSCLNPDNGTYQLLT